MQNQFTIGKVLLYVIFFATTVNITECIELSFYYFYPKDYCVMLIIEKYFTEING